MPSRSCRLAALACLAMALTACTSSAPHKATSGASGPGSADCAATCASGSSSPGSGSTSGSGAITPTGVSGGSSGPTPTSGGTPNALAAEVSKWVKTATPEFSAIVADQGAITASAQGGATKAVQADCTKLARDVAAFRAGPPAPDAELRADLVEAMGHYSSASTSCLRGNALTTATELEAATASVSKATARITALGKA